MSKSQGISLSGLQELYMTYILVSDLYCDSVSVSLALASFSGRDETGGNHPSTTDNEETELCMKETIDLSAPH